MVDHEQRRREIAEALWRVVLRDGAGAVSVRTVAAEAGTAPSALRHYFTTQDELLAFGLRSMIERGNARFERDAPGLPGIEQVRLALEQFLPLDEERRAEAVVYLAFLGRAHADPGLRTVYEDAATEIGAVLREVVEGLAAVGALGAGRDVEVEVGRLAALLDGLTMHGALLADRYPPEHLRAVLRRHLADLAQPCPAGS